MTDNATPPDPYAADIATLKAAAATPLSTFEDALKTRRLRELAAEHAEMDATPPRLTDLAEVEAFAPPNPYTTALAAMAMKEAAK